MRKATVRDYNLAGKKVLLRVDYNVPIENGQVKDSLRIRASFGTINYLLDQNCSIVLISHLGRPDGKPNQEFSLAPVAVEAAKLLGHPIKFIPGTIGDQAKQAAQDLQPKEIILLENLRFDPREEKNDPEFAKELASLGEVFVDDAFAVIHRAHASTVGVTKFLPALCGLLVEKEVTTITEALENPKRPLLAMIGGAKISDKIEFLDRLLSKVDMMVIGGAMANTFLAAKGSPIGKSIYEPDQVGAAKKILEESKVDLVLPIDVVVADNLRPPKNVRTLRSVAEVSANDIIADLGPESVETTCQKLMEAGTVIWNGPFGLTEIPEFAKASLELAHCLGDSEAKTIIGGGDTAEFIDAANLHDKFDLVSTGGGAALELMAGKELPGLEALLDK